MAKEVQADYQSTVEKACASPVRSRVLLDLQSPCQVLILTGSHR